MIGTTRFTRNGANQWLACFACLLLASSGIAGESLRKIDSGPFDVEIIEELTFRDEVQGRDVTFRVLYPDADGPFPVVVYSTGMLCWPHMYDPVTTKWVSYGYIVIHPNHLDSPNRGPMPSAEELEFVVESRVRDVSFTLDVLDQIGARAGIADKIDAERIAVGGHSFGAVVAMSKIGLLLDGESLALWGDAYDPRFQAAVLMSAPGPGIVPTVENAYAGIRRPFIATGGSNDTGRVDPGELSGTEWRRQAYYLAPSGDKYSFITEGTDHYMGGLLCNPDRGGEPDPGAAEMVGAMTTVFLDAYIKDDADALEYLQTVDVPARTDGRASYLQK